MRSMCVDADGVVIRGCRVFSPRPLQKPLTVPMHLRPECPVFVSRLASPSDTLWSGKSKPLVGPWIHQALSHLCALTPAFISGLEHVLALESLFKENLVLSFSVVSPELFQEVFC